MEEKMNLLYSNYLEDRLSLIFESNNGQEVPNPLYEEKTHNTAPTVRLNYRYCYYDDSIGIGIVQNRDKFFNFVDKDGYLLSKVWLPKVGKFINGRAYVVNNDGKANFIDTDGNEISNQWFDDAYGFSEGYARVKKGDNWYFIDTDGNPLFDIDYLSKINYYVAGDFHDGYARIKKGRKTNFINVKGDLLFDENFLLNKDYNIVGDFHDGYAIVEKRNRFNYINDKGELLCDFWLEEAQDFSEGFARVVVNGTGETSFINAYGELVGNEWRKKILNKVDRSRNEAYTVDYIGDFHNGYARVSLGYGYYNYINTEGELLVEKVGLRRGFDEATDFENGYATVTFYGNNYQYDGTPKHKVITKDGKVFDRYSERAIVQGYTLESVNGIYCIRSVEDGKFRMLPIIRNYINKLPVFISANINAYYYMNKDGIDFSNLYHVVSYFAPGIVKVVEDDCYNLVSLKDGKKIFEDIKFDKICDFSDGYALAYADHKCNFIDVNGNLLFKDWLTYDSVGEFKYGYIYVSKGGKSSLIDKTGKPVLPFAKYKELGVTPEFFIINNQIKPKHVDMGEYNVNKTPLGYLISNRNNKKDKFLLKEEPIKMIGTRYVLCHNKKIVSIYDRLTNKYREVSTVWNLKYNDYFICDIKKRNYNLIYDGKVIELPNYYVDKLLEKKDIKIDNSHTIYSEEDFFCLNEDEVRDLIRKEREEEKKREEKEKEKETHKELQVLKEKDKKEQAKMDLMELEAVYQIEKSFNQLKEIEKKKGTKARINLSKDLLFEKIGDHEEIKPIFIISGWLSHINLSTFSFKNVKVSGIDFRDCNIVLKPQEVYNKDLSNCNFEGLHIEPFMDFTGVDIRGARFSSDKNSMTIDYGSLTFRDAIYDENTTYNGIPFTIIFGDHEKDDRENKIAV